MVDLISTRYVECGLGVGSPGLGDVKRLLVAMGMGMGTEKGEGLCPVSGSA